MVLYWIGKSILWPVLAAVFRPWVSGLKHVPATGPAILASNHLSLSDSFFLPVVVPRRVAFAAKSEYFTGRGLKGRAKAMFFRGVGQVPIDRSGGAAAEGAIATLAGVLERGDLVGIYPEGTRSPDGRLYRGRTGIARLALRTQQILAYEAGVTETPDPLAGSYYVESLTNELEAAAWAYLDEIESLGGTLAAIERG